MTHPRSDDDLLVSDEPEHKKACVSLNRGFSPGPQLLKKYNAQIANDCKERLIRADNLSLSDALYVLETTLKVCGRGVALSDVSSFVMSNENTNIIDICRRAVTSGNFLELMQIGTSSSVLDEYVLTQRRKVCSDYGSEPGGDS